MSWIGANDKQQEKALPFIFFSTCHSFSSVSMCLYFSVLDLDKMTQLHSSVTRVSVLVLSSYSSSSALSNSLLVIQMCRFAFFFLST